MKDFLDRYDTTRFSQKRNKCVALMKKLNDRLYAVDNMRMNLNTIIRNSNKVETFAEATVKGIASLVIARTDYDKKIPLISIGMSDRDKVCLFHYDEEMINAFVENKKQLKISASYYTSVEINNFFTVEFIIPYDRKVIDVRLVDTDKDRYVVLLRIEHGSMISAPQLIETEDYKKRMTDADLESARKMCHDFIDTEGDILRIDTNDKMEIVKTVIYKEYFDGYSKDNE